jgi:hypothetical protein
MKIALIVNTRDPGQSGVGDYALRLASKLSELGVETRLVVPRPTGEDVKRAVSELQAFQPDWTSFQFVPYAFARRGLVNRRSLPWESLKGYSGTHFMFHEVWIGAHEGASIRQQLMGFLQRRGIQSVMRRLRPDVVHCSNRLYSAMLRGAGIENQVLPLFGNIPIAVSAEDPCVEKVRSLAPGTRREDWTVAALFGTIYPARHVPAVLRWLLDLCQRHGRRLLLVSLGHCPLAEEILGRWKQALGEGLPVDFLVGGRMSADRVSAWMQSVDCALATTPFNIIEKSGSAVAFAEHGVPVIVADDGAPVRGISLAQADLAPAFWLFGDQRLMRWQDLPPRKNPKSRLDEIASQFLANLERSGKLKGTRQDR